MRKLKLAVLISGGGTNLQALIDACKDPEYPAEIIVVVSNEPGAYGLKRAQSANIPTHIIPHKDYNSREEFDRALDDCLQNYSIDLVCLAGFMRILGGDFVQKWKGRMINTHPSLLPKFGGEGMYGHHVHNAVLAAGERISGSTIHFVTEGVDQGPVILQKEVPVFGDDSLETLAARVQEEERKAYVEAVQMIAEGKVKF